jgi:hypothetical protein
MNTLCVTVVTGRQGEKHVHYCPLCRTEYLSRYLEPSKLKVVCRVKKRRAETEQMTVPEWGPGNEMDKLISSCGLASFGCNRCVQLALDMNRWGPDGCRARRDQIVSEIRGRADKVNWWDKSKAAMHLIREPWFNLMDPIGSMVDEAIRRADAISRDLVAHFIEEIRGPAKPRSPWWNSKPEIVAAHGALLDEAAAREYETSESSGRGIVTLAGGEYFAAGYVLVRVLRSLGCTLPVEWWYLPGEMSPTERAIVEPLGVQCVALADRCQPRRVGGWEAKVHAIMHSRFAEVLFLDSDQVPVRDPTYLFDDGRYVETGAVFWQDNPPYGFSLSEEAFHVARLSVPERTCDWRRPSDYDAWETGQILVNKRRHWKPLSVTAHLCDHSEFWFPQEHRGTGADVRYGYGD